MLADSNLIIYAASGDYPDLVEWFAETTPAVSAVSNQKFLPRPPIPDHRG
jgi:hypothetical protein